jgi:protoheme IX farnesyltransferase
LDLVRLTKPRITAMVVLTGLSGAWLAGRTGAAVVDWPRTLIAMIGVALVVSGANALNMFLERDVDALMTRTMDRPLPAGRLAPRVALAFGLLIGFGAIPLLAIAVNGLTAALAGASLIGYVWIYTPLKRATPWAVVIGAIPGAMPPLLGWTAVVGEVGGAGLALFAVLFFWQLPHFLAIATFRSEEYTRAGIKIFPAIHGDRITRMYARFFSLALVAASLSLVPLCFWRGGGPGDLASGGWFYLISAALLGAAFIVASVRVPALSSRAALTGPSERIRWAKSLFVASLVYLPALLAAMMVSA